MFHNQSILQIASTLLDKKESIAVAESVTAGFLQAAISSADNAINFFQGGITVYNLGQNHDNLILTQYMLLNVIVFLKKIATDMALNVSHKFSSEWGIGVTGYATPVPESGNKLFAYYAITYQDRVLEAARLDSEKKEPMKLQLYYTNFIIDQLKEIML